MHWITIVLALVAPVPIDPRVSHPDPMKNEWVVSCSSWNTLLGIFAPKIYKFARDELTAARDGNGRGIRALLVDLRTRVLTGDTAPYEFTTQGAKGRTD